jgi:hypothetical protein
MYHFVDIRFHIPQNSKYILEYRLMVLIYLTVGTITAYQALDKGLSDLMALGEDIKSEFLKASAK